MGNSKIVAMMAALVVVVILTPRVAEGQTPDCASKLAQCANFLNTTGAPPASCCDPLKEVVTNQLTCLCNLYNTPGLLASLNINATEALLLPSRCSFSSDPNACSKASAPASPSPPATPGNEAGRFGWIGIPGMLLLWASVMLY